MKMIDDKNSVESNKLLSFLFLEGNELTDNLEKEENLSGSFIGPEVQIRPAIAKKLSAIFKRHCASEISVPEIYPHNNAKSIFVWLPGESVKLLDLRKTPPKDDILAPIVPFEKSIKEPEGTPQKRVVRYTLDVPIQEEKVILLDHRRVLIQLPISLHLPWCRYITRTSKYQTSILRRYCFGDTYAYQERNMKSFYKACFDIVLDIAELQKTCDYKSLNELSIWQEAEVIKIIDEIFQENDTKGVYRIVINSTLLIDYCFGECGITDELRIKIYKFLKKAFLTGRRNSLSTIKNLNKSLAAILPKTSSVEKFTSLINVQAKAPAELDYKMTKISAFKRNPLWDYALGQLEILFSYLQMMNINSNKISIDMSLMPDNGFIYHSGLIFNVFHDQPIKQKQLESHIVAIGGRYDNTLYQCMNPCYPKSIAGVGVDISCDALSRSIIEKLKKEKQEILLVFEAIFGKTSALDKECMWIWHEAWRKNIAAQAEFYEKRKLEEWIKYSQANNIEKLIIIKPHFSGDKFIAIIRNFKTHKKEEIEISTIPELADYIFQDSENLSNLSKEISNNK